MSKLMGRVLAIGKRILIALAVLGAGCGLFYLALIRPTRIIDRLAVRARPETALPGPEVKPELVGIELSLSDTYGTALLTESTAVSEYARLAVINRWTRELYPYFNAYMLACALDPPSAQIAQELRGAIPEETAANICTWATDNLLQSQFTEPFEDMPGHDPWGALTLFEPAFKKLLPSEMRAESLYTGKMSGKCCALAALITGLFTLEGASPEDVVIFRLPSHNLGLVRYAGKTYLINNQRVDALEDQPRLVFYIDDVRFNGFFAYSLALMKQVDVTTAILTASDGLVPYVADAAGAADRLAASTMPASAFANRQSLYEAVFGTTDSAQLAHTYTLARYAYQSLYVRNPNLYLQASLRTPNTRELARRLRTPDQMIAWIQANVAYGPLFEDYTERIMTSEQVIVFRRGTYKDQAVLFYALLKLNGQKPEIAITRDNAFVTVGQQIYEASTWRTVDEVPGRVELRLALD